MTQRKIANFKVHLQKTLKLTIFLIDQTSPLTTYSDSPSYTC